MPQYDEKYNNKINFYFLFSMYLFIFISIYFRFSFGDGIRYSLFFDRDIFRAYNLYEDFQFAGAELSQGGRAPGGFYYYLLALIRGISPDPLHIHWIMLLMNVAGIAWLGYLGLRHFGLLAGVAAAAFYATAFEQYGQHFRLWNPGFVSLFAVGTLWFFLQALSANNPRHLSWCGLLAAFLTQIHLSGIFLLVLVPISYRLFIGEIRIRDWLWYGAAVFMAFSPAIVYEVSHNLETIRSMGMYRDAFYEIGRVDTIAWNARLTSFIKLGLSSLYGIGLRDWPTTATAWLTAALGVGASSFMFAVGFLYPIVVRISTSMGMKSNSQDITSRETAILRALVFVIVVSFFSMMILSISDNARKFNILLPLTALIAGLFLRVLFHRVREKLSGRKSVFVLGLIAIWGVSHFTWSTLYAPHNLKEAESLTSLGETQHAVAALRNQFHFSDEDISRRVSWMRHLPDGNWTFIGGRTSAVNYLLALHPESAQGKSEGINCLMLMRHSINNLPIGLKEIEKAFSIIPKGVVVDRILEPKTDKLFTYVPYSLKSENCIHTFTNRYILTNNERLIDQNIDKIRDNTLSLFSASENEIKMLFNTGGSTNDNYLVVLRSEKGERRASLHGNQLRGEMGLLRHRFLRPRLELLEKDSLRVLFTLDIFNGWLGGQPLSTTQMPENNIFLTPWSSEPELVPSGEYLIRFAADNLAILKRDYGAFHRQSRAAVSIP